MSVLNKFITGSILFLVLTSLFVFGCGPKRKYYATESINYTTIATVNTTVTVTINFLNKRTEKERSAKSKEIWDKIKSWIKDHGQLEVSVDIDVDDKPDIYKLLCKLHRKCSH